jgi:uncharacterized protein (TIGR03437 family)
VKLTKFALVLLALIAATAWKAPAQTWDTSGNGLLNGTYYFRQVLYFAPSEYGGQLSEASVVSGTITFNGAGTYSANVAYYDTNLVEPQTGSVTGTYSIAASGYGFLSSLLYSGDSIYGLVNQAGIFVGSTTETANGYNDMFVGAPLSSPEPTVATFTGSYSIAGIDLSSGNPDTTINYLWQVSPDGVKNLGTSSLTAYVGEEGANKYTQSIASVTYAASNGAIVFTLPDSTSGLVTGQKFLYISPDGNFVFGGEQYGFDMFVGVRTGSGAPSLSGLYYQAGIDQDDSQLSIEGGALDTYYGSLSAGSGNIVEHQRYLSPFDVNSSGETYAIDYTLSDTYSTPSASGAYSTPAMNYVVGAGGVRIGSGIGPYLGINVALPAPTFSGSAPYLNPTGVVNAASSAPFTAGIAPGELLTLYGTGLADSLVVAPQIPFPTTLGNVQVMINGTAAPIYYVSPTQVSAIVPYEISGTIADVQVITDSNPSNIVSTYINQTSVGVFSVPPGGIGNGAVLHQSGQLVTAANPAVVGETVSVYLTGLGAVSPTIPDGAAGPVSTLSQATNAITADINGTTATVSYSGLAPQLAGLYQVNLTIPTGLTNGANALDIGGPDSYTSEVLISIAGGTAADRPAIQRAVPHVAKGAASLPRRKPQ